MLAAKSNICTQAIILKYKNNADRDFIAFPSALFVLKFDCEHALRLCFLKANFLSKNLLPFPQCVSFRAVSVISLLVGDNFCHRVDVMPRAALPGIILFLCFFTLLIQRNHFFHMRFPPTLTFSLHSEKNTCFFRRAPLFCNIPLGKFQYGGDDHVSVSHH